MPLGVAAAEQASLGSPETGKVRYHSPILCCSRSRAVDVPPRALRAGSKWLCSSWRRKSAVSQLCACCCMHGCQGLCG